MERLKCEHFDVQKKEFRQSDAFFPFHPISSEVKIDEVKVIFNQKYKENTQN